MMEECKWVDNDEQGTGYDTDWPEDNANGGWDETGRDSNNNVDQGIGKAAEPANADFWEIQEIALLASTSSTIPSPPR